MTGGIAQVVPGPVVTPQDPGDPAGVVDGIGVVAAASGPEVVAAVARVATGSNVSVVSAPAADPQAPGDAASRIDGVGDALTVVRRGAVATTEVGEGTPGVESGGLASAVSGPVADPRVSGDPAGSLASAIDGALT